MQIALRRSTPASRSCKPRSSNKRRSPRVSARSCSWHRALRHSSLLVPTRLATRPQFRCSCTLARAVALPLPRSFPPVYTCAATTSSRPCHHVQPRPNEQGRRVRCSCSREPPCVSHGSRPRLFDRGGYAGTRSGGRASMHSIMSGSSANYPVTTCTMRRKQGGETALMIAASKGHEMVVCALVNAGANASSKTLASSARRLHVGRAIPCQFYPCCSFLQESATALHLAAQHGHSAIVRFLMEIPGVRINEPSRVRACVRLTAFSFASSDCTDVTQTSPPASVLQGGWTPLHRAAAGNSVPVIRALLSADALQANPALWVRDMWMPGTAQSLFCVLCLEPAPASFGTAGWPHAFGHCTSAQER